MGRIKFAATLVQRGRHVCIDLPETASRKLGSEGRVAVAGSLNGYPFDGSVFPTGEGSHYLVVTREMRSGGSVEVGGRAQVVLEPDHSDRFLEIPADLTAALAEVPRARDAFADLSPSHKREYLAWIQEARRPDTRARRVERTVKLLSQTEDPS